MTKRMLPPATEEDWATETLRAPRHGGGIVKCPACGENTPDKWQFVEVRSTETVRTLSRRGRPREFDLASELATPRGWLSLDWMHCANDKCRELIVRAHERNVRFSVGIPMTSTETWLAAPRFAGSARWVDPVVSDEYRRDYLEAAALLDVSPRMSAVLSRRILADLLEEFAGRSEYRLSVRIDHFIEDTSRPIEIRENMHAVRTVADLGAHTKREKDDQAEIIETSRDEAEWALDVIDRLFDWFIVRRAKDAAMRAAINAKRIAAGQEPIPELDSPSPDGSR